MRGTRVTRKIALEGIGTAVVGIGAALTARYPGSRPAAALKADDESFRDDVRIE